MNTTHLLFASSLLGLFAMGCDPISIDGGTGGSSATEALTACEQTEACPTSQPCLSPVDNAGKQVFGLRVTELAFSRPTAFSPQNAGPIINAVLQPDLSACGLQSGGNTALLLGVDLTDETLTFGAAVPPSDPTGLYSFANASATLGTKKVEASSVTAPFTRNAAGNLISAPFDVTLPIWLDPATAADGGVVIPQAFPIHQMTFGDVALSSSNSCVGTYLPSLFDPKAGCTGTTDGLSFDEGGAFSGFVTLEEADTFELLGQTMCVLLAGEDATSFQDTSDPNLTRCARKDGAIAFHGDWCSATNASATDTCFDAMFVFASFAANGARL